MELEVTFRESQQTMLVELFENVAVPSLPKLDNPGTAEDLAEGKQLIDENGNVVEGTADFQAVARSIIDRTITEYIDDSAKEIQGYAFYACQKLAKVDCPEVTEIGPYAFASCTSLTSVNLPLVASPTSYMSAYAFNGCSALKNISLPALLTTGSYMFQRCTQLAYVELGSCTNIVAQAFYGCSALKTIVLRSSTGCTLSNVNSFTNTPFASGGTGGKVYVPEALIAIYKTATNWSTLYGYGTCEFVAIEGSEYE